MTARVISSEQVDSLKDRTDVRAMTPFRDDPGVPERAERTERHVSPELVLVDPELAMQVLARLPEPIDTLAFLEARVQASLISSSARRLLEAHEPFARSESRSLHAGRPVSRYRQRRPAVVAGCVAGGLLVAALMLGVRVDMRGNPAGADTTDVVETLSLVVPAHSPPISVPSRPRRGEKPKPSGSRGESPPRTGRVPRRFAWAPTPGASAYHVELFRGSSKVYEADAKRPAITIPARWVFDRRRQSLEPGDYRWYVWPVVAGRRVARGIVQARLAIPPG